MKPTQDIIKRIVLTEKGSRLTSFGNQYLFEVSPDSNKLEIKRAVEQLFKVNVTRVNTMNRRPKATSARRFRPGRTAGSKRALVKLKSGEKIDLA